MIRTILPATRAPITVDKAMGRLGGLIKLLAPRPAGPVPPGYIRMGSAVWIALIQAPAWGYGLSREDLRFHSSMAAALEPLLLSGEVGVFAICQDGWPILIEPEMWQAISRWTPVKAALHGKQVWVHNGKDLELGFPVMALADVARALASKNPPLGPAAPISTLCSRHKTYTGEKGCPSEQSQYHRQIWRRFCMGVTEPTCAEESRALQEWMHQQGLRPVKRKTLEVYIRHVIEQPWPSLKAKYRDLVFTKE